MADEAVVERLLADALFAPLPAPMVERLARETQRQLVATGSVVIAQGDIGDSYYLVNEGTAAVTIDGVHLAHLGPGDSFGEIALVRNIPRTASVTATSVMQLLAVHRDVFLEAVTGHPRSRRTADETVERFLGPRPDTSSN